MSSAARRAAYLGERPRRAVKASVIRDFTVATQERLTAKTVHELQLGLRRFFRFLFQEREVRRDPTHEMNPVR